MLDGVVLYACIGSACLASILVGAVVVACRRRAAQPSPRSAATAAAVAGANHRLQMSGASDKHRLSVFDAYALRSVEYNLLIYGAGYNYDSISIRLRFDCNSTALKPFDDPHHNRAAALQPK